MLSEKALLLSMAVIALASAALDISPCALVMPQSGFILLLTSNSQSAFAVCQALLFSFAAEQHEGSS